MMKIIIKYANKKQLAELRLAYILLQNILNHGPNLVFLLLK